MRSTITLNGKNSNEIQGLLIQSLPPISKPLMRTEVEEIDGRDGDITTNLGYSAYNKEISIGLYGNFDIDEIIAYFASEGVVTFSNEPDKYYNYQIIDQIDFEKLIRFKTATVTMKVQPFKYSTTEGTEIFSPSDNFISFSDFSKTTNGVTLTASDGVINIKGSPTAATEFYLPIDATTLSAGSYTLSATSNGQNSNYCSIRLIGSAPSDADSFGNKYITLVSNGTISLNATLSTSKTYNYLWFYMNPGTTFNFNLQIRLEDPTNSYASGEGTLITLENTALAPFHKFDIKGDTSQTTYSGKNLCPTTSRWFWLNQATTTAGKLSGNSGVIIPVTQNTDYTISVQSSQARYRVGFVDTEPANEQDTVTAYNGANGDGTSNTLTVNSGSHSYLIVNVTDLTACQVEKGSTATSFEPYVGGVASPNPDYPREVQTVTGRQVITIDDGGEQSQSYEINLGKNLLKTPSTSITSNGITFTPNSDGSFNLSGTATANADFNVIVPLANSGIKSGEQYTLSTNGSNITYFVFNCDENGTWKKTLMSFDGNSSKTCPETTADYVNIVIRVTSGTTINANNVQTMLEKGSTATSYAPYFEPIELCKIGNYQDYIYKQDGDWYLHKAVGKYTILESDIAQGADYTNVYFASFPKQTDDLAYGAYPNAPTMVMDIAIFQAYSSSWNRDIYVGKFVASATGNRYWVGFTAGTTLASAKEKMTGGVIYYALATPTDTKITNEALLEQLENLDTAHAYKGTTNLASTSENLPHIMAVSVAKDNDFTITNSGNTTAKPVMTIYGSGSIALYLNGYQIFNISLGDTPSYITIDIANMEAYQDTTDNLMNRSVDGDYDNFVLQPGSNSITFSGNVTKVEISNYSRWI